MNGLTSGRRAASPEQTDAPPQLSASVTTTVVLPPDALTVVAPAPDMISQLNVEQMLGIPARTYLELQREPGCPVAITQVGKLRLVDRHEFRRWLVARGKARRAAVVSDKGADSDALPTLEEQMRLGIKPAARAAGRR